MHKSAEKIAKVIDLMVTAVDPDQKHESHIDLMDFSWGKTFNDGGRWYTGVFRTPCGSLYRAQIKTDYRIEDVAVEEVLAETRALTFYKSGR